MILIWLIQNETVSSHTKVSIVALIDLFNQLLSVRTFNTWITSDQICCLYFVQMYNIGILNINNKFIIFLYMENWRIEKFPSKLLGLNHSISLRDWRI